MTAVDPSASTSPSPSLIILRLVSVVAKGALNSTLGASPKAPVTFTASSEVVAGAAASAESELSSEPQAAASARMGRQQATIRADRACRKRRMVGFRRRRGDGEELPPMMNAAP